MSNILQKRAKDGSRKIFNEAAIVIQMVNGGSMDESGRSELVSRGLILDMFLNKMLFSIT